MFALDTNPRIIAKMLMEKSMRDVKMYASLSIKDCPCIDHDGSHEIHASQIRLMENFSRLHDSFNSFVGHQNADRLAADMLLFFEAEIERQMDLSTEVHLASWALAYRDDADRDTHGSSVT